MATLTNNSIHTGTMTNNAVMVQSGLVTWDQATFTWDQAGGTWDQPIAIANNSIHTASMTNNTQH